MTASKAYYATPPTHAVALEELEQAASARLCVFRVLMAMPSPERQLRQLGDLPESARAAVDKLDSDDKFDCVAHFALRLAFCTDRGRLYWLIDAECRLMAFRLRAWPYDEILQLLRERGHNYTSYDLDHLRAQLKPRQLEWLKKDTKPPVRYCRVPFQQAAKLTGLRQVVITGGHVWIPIKHMYHVAVHHFKGFLRMQLVALHRSLPAKQIEMDRLSSTIERIYMDSLQTHHLSSALLSRRQGDAPHVTLENIDELSEKYFPLCMKHLHRKMRQNHHLKYDGRVQYRMFLKGLGFSVQDNVVFFRNEFTKVISPAKFDKEYVYHIRHSYGLEGARKDYAPMDCSNIIHGGAPRHGQYHGCPFKHWDSGTLQSELKRLGLKHMQAESIANVAAQGNHQRACVAFFNATHTAPYEQESDHEEEDRGAAAGSMHPNRWVEASIHLRSS